MKIFLNPTLFAEHLIKTSANFTLAMHVGLDTAAHLVERTAKAEIGHLQPEVGPFNAWEELTESTKADKARKGFVFNKDFNPLLRTGALQNSIKHEIKPLVAYIGSISPIMPFQEFGTRKMPPRPVLGPAAFRSKKEIRALIAAAALAWLKSQG